MALTIKEIEAIKPGEWLSDDARRGAGRLVAFGMKNGGAAFYFRYANDKGARDSLPLGHFDPRGRKGITLAEASERAGELARRYQSGERNLREAIEAEKDDAARRQRNAEAQDQADRAKDKATLGALLSGYVAQLRRDGKTSADAVEGAINLHVRDAWPALWAARADAITMEDCLSIFGKIIEAKKYRQAGQVRSYMLAAYTTAIRSRQDARGLAELRELGIRFNPVRDTAAIEGASNARERALSVAELRAYWQRIEKTAGTDGALLRFHLLTGGQRIEQLSRVTTHDIDHDIGAMIMRDPKGRRRKPRTHIVPLTQPALDALKAMQGGTHGEFAFTVDGGMSGAKHYNISSRLNEIRDAMADADELQHGPFTVGDLRRTVETRLAAAGISTEVRAQLQSHGLGGVQSRHYDRHDYLDEKRAALETLHRIVTGSDATVTPIKRAKARQASH